MIRDYYLFPEIWVDKHTARLYVQTRRFSDSYGQWQEVKQVFGPLWRSQGYEQFRDNTCNFEKAAVTGKHYA